MDLRTATSAEVAAYNTKLAELEAKHAQLAAAWAKTPAAFKKLFTRIETTDEVLQTVLHKIIPRTMKLLTRKGVLVEEQGQTYMADDDADSEETRVLRPLQAAACTDPIAFSPRASQKVLTLQGAMPRDTDFKQTLYADIDGFSLHAAARTSSPSG